MSREAAKIVLSPDEIDELNRWIKSGKTEQRKVERAKIVLRSADRPLRGSFSNPATLS
jgi:hypothetical protein